MKTAKGKEAMMLRADSRLAAGDAHPCGETAGPPVELGILFQNIVVPMHVASTIADAVEIVR